MVGALLSYLSQYQGAVNTRHIISELESDRPQVLAALTGLQEDGLVIQVTHECWQLTPKARTPRAWSRAWVMAPDNVWHCEECDHELGCGHEPGCSVGAMAP